MLAAVFLPNDRALCFLIFGKSAAAFLPIALAFFFRASSAFLLAVSALESSLEYSWRSRYVKEKVLFVPSEIKGLMALITPADKRAKQSSAYTA